MVAAHSPSRSTLDPETLTAALERGRAQAPWRVAATLLNIGDRCEATPGGPYV
ncbi:MAG: hypothetical protein SNJ69_01930 [Chloroflexaceae bacterium]